MWNSCPHNCTVIQRGSQRTGRSLLKDMNDTENYNYSNGPVFLDCLVLITNLRVNPNSLSYPFPLVVRVHVRVRASSGFDRGVGVKGTGRYPLKPSIFTSLLETKRYQNTLRPDYPESIYGLNNLFKITTVLFCALHSPVTYIYICSHALNWNVFKNRYFSTLTLHCCFAQQSHNNH